MHLGPKRCMMARVAGSRAQFRLGCLASFAGMALACRGLAACGFDWTVRETPEEAGVAEAGGRDSAFDVDASDAASPIDAALADASVPDCTALFAEVTRTRKAAIACKLSSGQCTAAVKDQCNCDVVVALPGSAETAAYKQAVLDLVASGCELGCGTGCGASTIRNCLQQGADVICVWQ